VTNPACHQSLPLCRQVIYLDLQNPVDPVEIPERDAATVLILKTSLENGQRGDSEQRVSTFPSAPELGGRRCALGGIRLFLSVGDGLL
jgi:hypothetical protein